jgi:hypothetical protein
MFLTHQTGGWLGLHYFNLGSKLKKQSPINPFFKIKSRKKTITKQQQLFYSQINNDGMLVPFGASTTHFNLPVSC